MVFKCWAEIKIEIECRLHCIDINADQVFFLKKKLIRKKYLEF